MKRYAPLWLLLAALTLDLVVRAPIALRPIEDIDGHTIPDDAYLSLHLARSIARGQGPLYGAAHTNGFQPLYVFLMVPAFWLSKDPLVPVRAALILLVVSDAVALGFMLAWTRRVTRKIAPAAIVAGAWIWNPYAVWTSLNGLETTLAVAFAAALAWLSLDFLDGKWDRGRALVWGVVAGLAVQARIDNAFLVAAIALVWLLAGGARRLWRAPREVLPPLAGGLALGYGPWLLYSLYYTKSIYQVSGRAVRWLSVGSGSGTWPYMIGEGWDVILDEARLLVLALVALQGLALLLAWRRRRELAARMRALLPLYLFGLSLFFVYTTYIFGPWFFRRYLFACVVPMVLGIAVCADFVAGALRTRALGPILVWGFALALADRYSGDPLLAFLRTHKNDHDKGYMELGLWAKKHYAPGTVVGGVQSGALGYFADTLTVFNLDGVVNAECLEALRKGEMQKYLRKHKVGHVIGWQVNVEMVRNSAKGGEFTFMGLAPGFRSWNAPWELWRFKID